MAKKAIMVRSNGIFLWLARRSESKQNRAMDHCGQVKRMDFVASCTEILLIFTEYVDHIFFGFMRLLARGDMMMMI